MNWDQMEGKWKQFRGSLKEKWGKLTDDDLDYIGGKKDRFIGRLQERYGHSKEEAERHADEYIRSVGESATRTTGSGSDPYSR
jgi:uncharacterized protein YjbJ (UPF0337 family)